LNATIAGNTAKTNQRTNDTALFEAVMASMNRWWAVPSSAAVQSTWVVD
jgi:hypothetical protein